MRVFCQIHGTQEGTFWDGEWVCKWHQRVIQTEEGSVFMYDEFNQDGEEW
jgi:hypothetical protein